MQLSLIFKGLYLSLLLLFFLIKPLNAFADIYNLEDRLSKKEREEDEAFKNDFKKKVRFPNVSIGFINEAIFNSVLKDSNPITPEVKMQRDSRSFTRTRMLFGFGLSKEFVLNSNLVIEPVSNDIRHVFGLLDYAANEKAEIANFQSQGLIAEELNFQYRTKDLSLFFGKFNLNFGNGANRYSKLYDNTWYGVGGTDMNFAYSLREKLGVKFNFKITPQVFKVESLEELDDSIMRRDKKLKFYTLVAGGLFKADNTNFFKSSITNKNALYYNNNAGSDSIFRSYFVNTDFVAYNSNFKSIVSLGHASQAAKNYNLGTQNSYVISGQQIFYPAPLFKFGIFGEYAMVKNFDGIIGANQYFATASMFMGYEGLNVTFVYNKFKANDSPAAGRILNVNQNLYTPYLKSAASSNELTFGYDFKTGFGFKIGRKTYWGLSTANGSLANMSSNHIMCNYALNY